jgi:hypothetical protein
MQILELASSGLGSLFNVRHVEKIKLLLQAFELVAVRAQQVFEVADTIVGHGTLHTPDKPNTRINLSGKFAQKDRTTVPFKLVPKLASRARGFY